MKVRVVPGLETSSYFSFSLRVSKYALCENGTRKGEKFSSFFLDSTVPAGSRTRQKHPITHNREVDCSATRYSGKMGTRRWLCVIVPAALPILYPSTVVQAACGPFCRADKIDDKKAAESTTAMATCIPCETAISKPA